MPIPVAERQHVAEALEGYRQKRIPAAIRSERDLVFQFKGNSVVLLERYPKFGGRRGVSEVPVAKFRYSVSNEAWTLYWCDRNLRWHRYEGFGNIPMFEVLLDELHADPTGIFWGWQAEQPGR